jgi:uncharacterized protein (DUF305 family)
MKNFLTIAVVFLVFVVSGCNTQNIQQKINQHSQVDQKHQNHSEVVTDILSFVSQMIPHHQEAIDTSMLVLSQTSNLQLKTMLQQIIDSQTKEKIIMEWRLTQYFSGQEDKIDYMKMMRPLQSLTWWDLDTIYMQDMIVHHQGAIDMANKILSIMTEEDPRIKVTEQMWQFRSQIKLFAQSIIDAQTKEINQFQKLLK